MKYAYIPILAITALVLAGCLEGGEGPRLRGEVCAETEFAPQFSRAEVERATAGGGRVCLEFVEEAE